MGWDFTNRPPHKSVRDMVRSHYEFTHPDGIYSNRVLDYAVVGLTAYLAVEKTYATGERYVWAGVALLRYAPKEPYYNFGIKTMDETVGPCEDRCPARILDLLTDPPGGDGHSEWAAEWRQRCRARLAALAKVPPLQAGTVVVYAQPLQFRAGLGAQSQFTIVATTPWRVKSEAGVFVGLSNRRLRDDLAAGLATLQEVANADT